MTVLWSFLTPSVLKTKVMIVEVIYKMNIMNSLFLIYPSSLKKIEHVAKVINVFEYGSIKHCKVKFKLDKHTKLTEVI